MCVHNQLVPGGFEAVLLGVTPHAAAGRPAVDVEHYHPLQVWQLLEDSIEVDLGKRRRGGGGKRRRRGKWKKSVDCIRKCEVQYLWNRMKTNKAHCIDSSCSEELSAGVYLYLLGKILA